MKQNIFYKSKSEIRVGIIVLLSLLFTGCTTEQIFGFKGTNEFFSTNHGDVEKVEKEQAKKGQGDKENESKTTEETDKPTAIKTAKNKSKLKPTVSKNVVSKNIVSEKKVEKELPVIELAEVKTYKVTKPQPVTIEKPVKSVKLVQKKVVKAEKKIVKKSKPAHVPSVKKDVVKKKKLAVAKKKSSKVKVKSLVAKKTDKAVKKKTVTKNRDGKKTVLAKQKVKVKKSVKKANKKITKKPQKQLPKHKAPKVTKKKAKKEPKKTASKKAAVKPKAVTKAKKAAKTVAVSKKELKKQRERVSYALDSGDLTAAKQEMRFYRRMVKKSASGKSDYLPDLERRLEELSIMFADLEMIQEADTRVEELIEKAKKSVKKGKYVKAFKFYLKVIAFDPSREELKKELVRLEKLQRKRIKRLVAAKNSKQAILAYEAYLEIAEELKIPADKLVALENSISKIAPGWRE